MLGMRLPLKVMGTELILLLFLLPCVSGSDVWRKGIERLRQSKDLEFRTSKTSPMAGIQRLTVMPEKAAFIVPGREEIRIETRSIAGVAATLEVRNGKWIWTQAGGKVVPLAGGEILAAGRFSVQCFLTEKEATLIVFDPQRPQMKAFKGLLYFPPDRNFVVQATLEKQSDPKVITMLTSRSLEKKFFRYALVRFKLQGRDLRLTAYKSALSGEDAGFLFIPFSDPSNGAQTYPSGRFLEIDEPQGQTFPLDFNLCFNPLCNYAPVYNCPLPPAENNLPVAIIAGEKTYPHH